MKHWRISCFIVLGFWRIVPKTSYKGPKVTSGEWRSRDIRIASILNISKKRISVVIYSALVHQMCVLGTKKIVIAIFFQFCLVLSWVLSFFSMSSVFNFFFKLTHTWEPGNLEY